jgi:hypothetical protein
LGERVPQWAYLLGRHPPLEDRQQRFDRVDRIADLLEVSLGLRALCQSEPPSAEVEQRRRCL